MTYGVSSGMLNRILSDHLFSDSIKQHVDSDSGFCGRSDEPCPQVELDLQRADWMLFLT